MLPSFNIVLIHLNLSSDLFLYQLHLLSNIRPKINFEPWSGEDWSFSDNLVDVGLTLRSLFTEQLGRSLEDDSLIQTSVWQSLGQYVAV
jgi:hypothetical protein